MIKEYALYKGDHLLAIGTVEEIAKEIEVKKETILFYKYPAYAKRSRKSNSNRRVLIELYEWEV